MKKIMFVMFMFVTVVFGNNVSFKENKNDALYLKNNINYIFDNFNLNISSEYQIVSVASSVCKNNICTLKDIVLIQKDTKERTNIKKIICKIDNDKIHRIDFYHVSSKTFGYKHAYITDYSELLKYLKMIEFGKPEKTLKAQLKLEGIFVTQKDDILFPYLFIGSFIHDENVKYQFENMIFNHYKTYKNINYYYSIDIDEYKGNIIAYLDDGLIEFSLNSFIDNIESNYIKIPITNYINFMSKKFNIKASNIGITKKLKKEKLYNSVYNEINKTIQIKLKNRKKSKFENVDKLYTKTFLPFVGLNKKEMDITYYLYSSENFLSFIPTLGFFREGILDLLKIKKIETLK